MRLNKDTKQEDPDIHYVLCNLKSPPDLIKLKENESIAYWWTAPDKVVRCVMDCGSVMTAIDAAGLGPLELPGAFGVKPVPLRGE